jgi:hypothetical protein
MICLLEAEKNDGRSQHRAALRTPVITPSVVSTGEQTKRRFVTAVISSPLLTVPDMVADPSDDG